jgi:hypothetical protein
MNRATPTTTPSRLAARLTAALLLVSATVIIAASGSTSIRHPWDVALLVTLTVIAYRTDDFALPAFRLDVGLALAFAALVLTGPLGAVAVFWIPELIRPLVERHQVRRVATMANLASFSCAVLASQAVLQALPVAQDGVAVRWVVYAVAATAMALTQGLVTRGIVAGLVDRVLVSGWRIELRAVVAGVAFAPFAALTASLIPVLGILALVALAAAATLPGILVHLVTWTPRAGELTVPQARLRYTAALASRMSLSRSERRVLLTAARSGDGRVSIGLSASDRDRVAKTVLLAGLWTKHDAHSDDCFARLRPVEMGVESRVLRVAHGWAELTAVGTERLEHRLALLTLHNDPRHYDRRIVALARELMLESGRETVRGRVPHTREFSRRIAQLKQAA